MTCQLKVLPGACRPGLLGALWSYHLLPRAQRVLRAALRRPPSPVPAAGTVQATSGTSERRTISLGAPLGLRPGELVWVRPLAEILATLDTRQRCHGLPFMPAVMSRFCGRTFVVKRRVERFFDERSWRMLRLHNVVILEDACCEPAPDTGDPWAGCARSCFCFWSEHWLERCNGAAGTGPADAHR